MTPTAPPLRPPRSKTKPRKVAARRIGKPTARATRKKRTPPARGGPRGVEYRRVYPFGHSLGLTLPAACLRLLGVADGGTVQVVPHPSGKVIIAPMRLRVGVQKEIAAAGREVLYLRRQVGRLRKRLMAVPARSVARGVSIGFAKAWGAALMDLDREVKASWTEQRAFNVWLYNQIAPLLRSLSPDLPEQGADTSGAQLPGVPLEE